VKGALLVGVHALVLPLLCACEAVDVPASNPVPASGVPAMSATALQPLTAAATPTKAMTTDPAMDVVVEPER
jgi:hypothetical protein